MRTSAALVLAVLLVACTAAAPSPSPTTAPTPSAAPTASPSPSPSPSLAPTPSPAASTPAPSPTPTATPAGCVAEVDNAAPALNETFYVTGVRFAPGVDIEVQFDAPDPSMDFTFGGSGGPNPSMLHANDEGAFGPWDVTFTEANEAGEWTLTVSDGECESSVTVVAGP